MNIRTERNHVGKRFTAFITAISMTMALMPAFNLPVFAEGEFSGGSGTAASPYIIGTAEDLKALAEKVNAGEDSYAAAYYKIPTETYTYTNKGVEYTDGVRAVSINLSEYSPWTPIGTEEHPFKGHFNGSSNENKGNGSYGTINNARLQIAEGAYSGSVQTAGIFGYVEGATIENVAVSVPQIGDININTYSSGATAYHCVGGLVGFAKDSTIRFCTSYSPLYIKAEMGSAGDKKSELYVGGVVGCETGSEIFRCVNNSVVDVRCTEDNFEGNDTDNGKKFPDMFAGGIAGGVIGMSSNASKIHGSENLNEIVISIPRTKNADNIRLYSGGIVGGISGLEKDKLELCQDYNRSPSARARVTNSEGDPPKVSNAVACAGGIFGYDDAEKKVHVHDCKNDAVIMNAILLTDDSDNSLLYAGGIVAGRGNVDNCYNIAMITSMQAALSSGICYSVPHHCYSTGMIPGYGQPICVEEPADSETKYYNYFTNSYNAQTRNHPNWQCYVSDASIISNGELTWLLQGDQDPNYLHWASSNGTPSLGGGYYVKTGGRPLDYWLNRGWGAYNNDMPREIVSFAPAWSYRIAKYRYVTTGEGNDGVDPETGEDLKADTSFASFEKSNSANFYATGYGYYCGRVGVLPTVTETDSKIFVQWQTTPAASSGESVNLGSAFAYSGANSTVYAVSRVKFGANDEEIGGSSDYKQGNTIALGGKIEYGAEPDETENKFTYSLVSAAAENEDIDNAEQYFSISGENLTVAQNTPAGVYTVTVTATEKAQNITLFSASMGTEPVDFTVTVTVEKIDPEYTAPTEKTSKYTGEAQEVITKGSTDDGTMVYTLTPEDSSSWSESIPTATAVGPYTVYWKVIGDSNHKDTAVKSVSGVIIPDTADPAHAIIITPADSWVYDGNTYPLAAVTQNPGNIGIEWSTDNSTWSDTIPTAKDTGIYPVYWRTKSNAHGVDLKSNFEVEVKKASLTITPPTGLTKKYNGSAQALIEEGSFTPADKGTMKYSLNPSINDWSDDNWSTEIPTRTAAGDYKVYYRVFLNDTRNYTDTFDKANPTFVNAKITKLTNDDLNIKVVPAPDWTYDGNTYSLVQSVSQQALDDNGLRLMYSTDGGTKYDYTVPQGTDAGSYKVKWKTVGNANVEEITGEFTVTVSKRKPNTVIEKQADWTYDGKTYQLVTVKENNEKLRFSYSVNNGTPQNTPPYGQSAGTYKVSVTSQEDKNYETYQGSFEIVCSPVKATGTVTAKELTYNYSPQELVEPESVTNGKMMYRVGSEGAYSDTIPMRSDAGTYTVWYFVKGTDANYEDTAEQSVDVTIAPFDPNPTVNKSAGLVYNKAAQILLTVDTTEHHGTVMYKAQGDTDWSATVPKRENAGTYTVEWKVTDDSGRTDGGKNLKEYSGTETVAIGKYPAEIAFIHAEDKPYTGEEQQLVEPITALNGMGTVKYAVTTGGAEPSESDWSTDVPKATNADTYTVWFRIDGDENIEGVAPDKITVRITKIVPDIKVTVNSALRYNGEDQDLIASATDIATISPAGGTLLFAVTTDPTATANALTWSTEHPTGKDNGTYYVWYKFDGDSNTESIDPKIYTSVISGTVPTVAIRGEVLTYNKEAQDLIEGTVNGVDIKSNTDIKYYVTNDKSESYTDPADAAAWVTTFPQGTDAKKYYVWYYIPDNASEGTTAFGPAMVESEIKKAPAPDYDYSQEDSSKLAPDGKSFTKPWGTQVGEITLKYDEDNGGYKWHEQVKDRYLNTVGGPFNYPADFTDKTGNYEDGIVQIKITVTPLEEDPPNIRIDYINEKLTGFDPSRIYGLWGTTHTDSATLAITDGTDGTVNRMNDTNTEIVLEATDHTTGSTQNLTIPTRPAAPDMTVFEIHQPAFVTAQGRIGGIDNTMEYSVGDSGAWITGTGRELSVPQQTKVYVRYKAVAEDLPAQTGSFKSLPREISITESQRTQVTMNSAEVQIDYINHALIPEPGALLKNTKYTVTVLDENGNEGKKYRAETDENGKFPIEEDWHGKTVKIVKSGDILYTVDSEPKYKFVPLRPDPPEPESEDSKITNVKNNATETDEYRLFSGTAYTEVENAAETNQVAPDRYVVRVQATVSSFASLDSEVVIVKEKTPQAEIDYVKETLKNLEFNSEYIITEPDGNVITVITDANGEIPIEESWFGERVNGTDRDKILLIQKKGKSEEFNSDPQTRPIQPRPDKPNPNSWDSKITEVNSTMEYRLASATGSVYDSYKTVENNSETNVVVPDNYEVRYKAVAGVSFASLPEDIEVKPMDKPNGQVNITEVKIVNLQPNADYTIIDENDNEGIYTADDDGKVPIKEEWMGTDIRIIRNGDDARADSEPQILPIPERSEFPAKPDTTNSRGGGSGLRPKSTPTPAPSAEPDDGGDSGDNQGGDVPSLNKTDHFAYVSGYEDSTFRPDRTITRGEAAVIFARLMTDFDSAKTYTPAFPDLSESDYFYSYIGFLEDYGIITGYEDGTFRPWEPVTRTEFAVIASKFAELTETEENVFTDVDDDFWGKPFILLAHKNGWVNGYEDGTFRPLASITRAEVVSIVNRMLERSCDTEFARNNADDIAVFGDVSESHWAYNDIIEAANGHLYVTEDGGEVWTDLI